MAKKTVAELKAARDAIEAELKAAEDAECSVYLTTIEECIASLKALGREYKFVQVTANSSTGRVKYKHTDGREWLSGGKGNKKPGWVTDEYRVAA